MKIGEIYVFPDERRYTSVRYKCHGCGQIIDQGKSFRIYHTPHGRIDLVAA
jgi:hypothetical protein